MKKEKRSSCILGTIGVILLLALDQFTKYLASVHLKGGNSVILIKNVFQLQYLENRGAAFGLLQGQKLFFVLITAVMIIIMTVIYVQIPMEKRYFGLRSIIVLLMAGAFGNFIDRLRLNYVIDFFYFELINFPIFNVADIYVTCGMALLLILFLFYYKEEDLDQLWKLIKPGKKKA